MSTKSLFYDLKWKKASGVRFKKVSFLNSSFELCLGNNNDLKKLLNSARSSFKIWSSFDLKIRLKTINEIAEILKKNKLEIAKEVMKDTNKSLSECLGEIEYCYRLWKEPLKLNKKFFEENKKISTKAYVKKIKQPIGLVAVFIPFNNYMVVMSERIPFVLASGSIPIIKPNEMGMLGIIKFLDFINKFLNEKKKINPGIINLITGDKKLSQSLIKNKNISMIEFTGSYKVGKLVAETCSKFLKRFSLELGGKNPSIICSDANLENAIKTLVKDFTGNAGQNCVAISRVYIEEKIYEIFKKKFIIELQKKKFSQYNRNPKNIKNIKKYILKNLNFLSKKLVYGCLKNISLNFQPIVFEGLNENNYLYKEELFVPILIINKFKDINTALKKVNNSIYGLSGSIWTKNVKIGENIIKKYDCGRLWVNGSIYENYPELTVGGLKGSGNGRVSGIESVNNYIIYKTIIVNKY